MSGPNGNSGHDHHPPSSVGPVWTRRILGGFWTLCIFAVVLDFVIDRKIEHPWEGLKEFYPLWGFVGIVVLVLLSRGLRALVMRGEGYYDDR